MEFATTLGFVAFGSVYNPCIFCSCPKDLIHSYGGLNLAEDVWPDPVDYHAEVIQCEIRIRIDSALDIRRILEEGGLYWDRRTNGARGRALARDMPGLVGACGRSLRAGDRPCVVISGCCLLRRGLGEGGAMCFNAFAADGRQQYCLF